MLIALDAARSHGKQLHATWFAAGLASLLDEPMALLESRGLEGSVSGGHLRKVARKIRAHLASPWRDR